MSDSPSMDIPVEGGVVRPLASTPEREREVWRNKDLRESLGRGLEQSARGEVHDLGTFAQYVTDHDPAGMTPLDHLRRLASPDEMAGMGDANEPHNDSPELRARLNYARRVVEMFDETA